MRCDIIREDFHTVCEVRKPVATVLIETAEGDVVGAAYLTAIDLANLLAAAEKATGRDYRICRAQVQQITEKLKMRWAVANRPRVPTIKSEEEEE